MTKTSEPCTKEAALAAWEAEIKKAHPVSAPVVAAYLGGRPVVLARFDPPVEAGRGTMRYEPSLIDDWYRQMVLRHGGRGCDRWRFRGWDEEDYEKLAVPLRQGGVALVKAGEIVRFASAPRLRRNW